MRIWRKKRSYLILFEHSGWFANKIVYLIDISLPYSEWPYSSSRVCIPSGYGQSWFSTSSYLLGPLAIFLCLLFSIPPSIHTNLSGRWFAAFSYLSYCQYTLWGLSFPSPLSLLGNQGISTVSSRSHVLLSFLVAYSLCPRNFQYLSREPYFSYIQFSLHLRGDGPEFSALLSTLLSFLNTFFRRLD